MPTKKKVLTILLSVEEWEKFNTALAETPYRNRQEYARKLLLGDPVTIYYRNKSFDDLTTAFIGFKKLTNTFLAKAVLTPDEKDFFLAEFLGLKWDIASIYEDVRKTTKR